MISLGDRMKQYYENRSRYYLQRRTPVILRLDGKAFHTFTKYCEKPFDIVIRDCMAMTAEKLMNEIQGACLAYTQSDEISILVCDYKDITTEAWFDYNIQKMVSIAAAIATAAFNNYYYKFRDFSVPAYFDCRAFNLPKEEVLNYFYWRFLDWERNSIQMLGQTHFSHKQLHRKSCVEIQDMLVNDKGINWNDLDDVWKNGTFIYKVENKLVNKHLNLKLFENKIIVDNIVDFGL